MIHSFDAELAEFLNDAVCDVLAELEEPQEKKTEPQEADFRALLAQRQAIAPVWDADALLAHRPHLTRAQAWEVLQQCERQHKADDGLNWDVVTEVVSRTVPDGKQRPRSRVRALLRRLEALPDREADDSAGCGEVAARLDTLEADAKGR